MVLSEVPNISLSVVPELPNHFAVSGNNLVHRNCRRNGRQPGTAAIRRMRLGGRAWTSALVRHSELDRNWLLSPGSQTNIQDTSNA